jgi:Leucine-rich repeat (LRR) protein
VLLPPVLCAGLGSLQQLHLDDNRLTTLAPLSSCTQLQLLTATRNRLACTSGTGGLTCLRRLDIEGNAIRRLEAVAELRGATLLTSLNISDNPLIKVGLAGGFTE